MESNQTQTSWASQTLDQVVQKIVEGIWNDPELKDYSFSVDTSDPEIFMLVWDNPGEVQEWIESPYSEGQDGKAPMNALAFVEHKGEHAAYTLTPEEKFYKCIFTLEGDEDDEESSAGYDEDQIMPLNNYQDFRNALRVSLWEM